MAMSAIYRFLKAFYSDERGVTVLEYGLIGAAVVIGLTAGLSGLVGGISNLFTKTGNLF